jgi:hypothetical protein
VDINLLIAIIGVGGTLLGTALGSSIQWKFNKNQEKKEGRRLLIELKSSVVKQLYFISRKAILLRKFDYLYNYKVRVWKADKEEQLISGWQDSDVLESQKYFSELEKYQQEYFEAVVECYEPISAFVTYTKNNTIDNIFKQIYNLEKNKYQKLVSISIEDYLEIITSDEIEKASKETKEELEIYFNQLRQEIDKEILKYS